MNERDYLVEAQAFLAAASISALADDDYTQGLILPGHLRAVASALEARERDVADLRAANDMLLMLDDHAALKEPSDTDNMVASVRGRIERLSELGTQTATADAEYMRRLLAALNSADTHARHLRAALVGCAAMLKSIADSTGVGFECLGPAYSVLARLDGRAAEREK